ncbi:MAG: diacylglycerol kinase family lipid kinase [Dehalococcoidales bacterium]|nr:MAG: diacylglycerol kinase family lipid kinase [Dehalococcoidales bacterium]
MDTKAIVNPVAGSHSVTKDWENIRYKIQQAGLEFDFEFTQYPGHAVDIARQSIENGYRCLLAVGGDGTINEVANGILISNDPENTLLGVVNAGTANDFEMSLGISDGKHNTGLQWKTHQPVKIDVGVVKCQRQGKQVTRYFVNEVSVGLSAEVVEKWEYLPGSHNKKFNLFMRTITGYLTLINSKNKQLNIEIINNTETGKFCTVVVANGKYFADGMIIAPNATLDDGLLDSIIIGDISRYDLIKIRPKLYDGTHITHEKFNENKVSEISIESEEKLVVEADGDIIGESPVSIRVVPSALNVLPIY